MHYTFLVEAAFRCDRGNIKTAVLRLENKDNMTAVFLYSDVCECVCFDIMYLTEIHILKSEPIS